MDTKIVFWPVNYFTWTIENINHVGTIDIGLSP